MQLTAFQGDLLEDEPGERHIRFWIVRRDRSDVGLAQPCMSGYLEDEEGYAKLPGALSSNRL